MNTKANRLLRAALKAGKRAKPHKYGAKSETVEGVRFASRAEARRYQELRLLEKAGEIESLELQPRFPLKTQLTTGTMHGAFRAIADNFPVIGEYRGDFRYFDLRGRGWIVEDVKGLDTPLSRWKRKHVAAQYGVIVEIVSRKGAR